MNALIDFIQGIDGKIVPPVLILLFLMGLIWFGYRQFRNYSNSLSNHANREQNMSTTSNTFADLRNKWNSQRDYETVLNSSPIPNGAFQNWFVDETKICDDFFTERKKQEAARNGLLQEFPAKELEYLQIVGEINRRPAHWAIYLILFALLAVEATGFALIFADKLTDTATANAIQNYATGIACVIAFFALLFAEITGRDVYRQGFARLVWLEAKGRKTLMIATVGTQDEQKLAPAQNTIDQKDAVGTFSPRAIRITNRSTYVHNAIAGTMNDNKPVSRFRVWFYVYFAAVIIFGIFVGLTRLSDIDKFYSERLNEAVSQQNDRGTGTSAPNAAKGAQNRPSTTAEGAKDEEKAMTQENLEADRKGKQLAVAVFILIFFIAQTVGVVIASHHGFVSDHGKQAYKLIRQFRNRYGDISLEKFTSLVDANIQSADRYAQSTMKDWQLGLQDAFGKNNTQRAHQKAIESCVANMNSRTYTRWVEISAALSTTGKEGTPQLPPDAQNEPGLLDVLVDQEDGTIESLRLSFPQLHEKLLEGEIQSNKIKIKDGAKYISYSDFAKKQKGQTGNTQ